MFFHEERIMGNKDKCYDVPVDKENEKLKQRLFAGVDSAPLWYAKAIRLVKKKNYISLTLRQNQREIKQPFPVDKYIWAGLLEAWLALTSVEYHGNL